MKQKQILLIEDEASVIETIKLMLDEICGEKKYTIDSAFNFFQAMDYLEEKNYDIIVTDLQMPGKGLGGNRDYIDGTILNGWAFLYFHILEENGKYTNQCKSSKLIIFSEFLDELEKRFKTHPDEQSFKDRIRYVSKGGMHNDEGGTIKLCTVIEELIKSN